MLLVIFSFLEAIAALNSIWDLCLRWSFTLEHSVRLAGCLFVGSIPEGCAGQVWDEPLAGPPLTLAPCGCRATAPFSQLMELRFPSTPFPLLLAPFSVFWTLTHTPPHSLSLCSYFLFIPITMEFCSS